MGMDVYGNDPLNADGEYFRNNVWWWGPLWEYCHDVAPELASKVTYGFSNDGDGLDGEDSIALAAALVEALASGHTLKYEENFKAEKEKESQSSNESENFKSWYCFDTNNVEEFVTFLKNCGGFSIY
jgi:hypothetical protein